MNNEHHDETSASKQKELMRDWMIEQTAFKNLFKKYGTLPDGRQVKDLPEDEQNSIVAKEIDRIKHTQSDTQDDL